MLAQAQRVYGQSFLCVTAPISQLDLIARATGVRAAALQQHSAFLRQQTCLNANNSRHMHHKFLQASFSCFKTVA